MKGFLYCNKILSVFISTLTPPSISSLYEIMTGTYTGKSLCTISQSNENHKIVFAAEKSRLTNTVVEL